MTMNGAPLVLVVARYRDTDEAGRIRECVAKQTYQATRLVFVVRSEKEVTDLHEGTIEMCSESGLISHLGNSSVERVLFWPAEGALKEAAIEKLVLALQVNPDQNGVADAAKGGTGLWLARNGESMTSLIVLWLKSQIQWIEECQRRKPNFFFIAENLTDNADLKALRRPFAVESFFGKLPLRVENFQPITTEPLWAIPASEIDDRSVLFLVSSLPMGGACKFILDIAGQLKQQGYRVTVATTAYFSGNPNPWLDELLKITPDVFVLQHTRAVELPRQIVHLARTRRCGRVVVSHSMLGYQLLPWLRSELPGVSFLDYTHIEYETEWPNGGYALRSANNQSLFDLSMVSSEHLRQWMIKHGADGESIRVCHTNIDTEKWKPDSEARARTRYELGIDRKTTLILYPCRLTEQKRPELMCNIVAALRKNTNAPFVVVVAGDGPLMPALRSFIKKQGLDASFKLLGAVSLERVAQLHNAADIFLLPSLIEGIALALFEAMALESVPVVADVGGQRELVNPDCGYLIPVRDPKWEFADYVIVLKHLVENPELRHEKAAASRERVRKDFRLEQMTATFISILQEAGQRQATRRVEVPAPAVCRELATLAIDHIRVDREVGVTREMGYLLHDKVTKQEKIIEKLRQQLEAVRSANLTPEANELHC